MRKQRLIEHDGKSLTIKEWSKRLGIAPGTIFNRLGRNGWSISKAVSELKTNQAIKLTHKGESLTIREWSKRVGLSVASLKSRLERGWSVEKSLTEPKRVRGIKRCPKCGETDISKFGLNKHHYDGFQNYCRDCASKLRRLSKLYVKYNLTEEGYKEELNKQGGLCALCKKSPGGEYGGILVVDHNHDTGKRRGLIHHRCNLLLGQAGDSVVLLELAADYLRTNRI